MILDDNTEIYCLLENEVIFGEGLVSASLIWPSQEVYNQTIIPLYKWQNTSANTFSWNLI